MCRDTSSPKASCASGAFAPKLRQRSSSCQSSMAFVCRNMSAGSLDMTDGLDFAPGLRIFPAQGKRSGARELRAPPRRVLFSRKVGKSAGRRLRRGVGKQKGLVKLQLVGVRERLLVQLGDLVLHLTLAVKLDGNALQGVVLLDAVLGVGIDPLSVRRRGRPAR